MSYYVICCDIYIYIRIYIYIHMLASVFFVARCSHVHNQFFAGVAVWRCASHIPVCHRKAKGQGNVRLQHSVHRKSDIEFIQAYPNLPTD